MNADEEVPAAARRLAGHLVATPLIGGLWLPGFACAPDLRIKPESVQSGGSIHFRGAMHALARRFGGLKGVVAHGALRPAMAVAAAAAAQRLPCVVVLAEGDATPAVRAVLAANGCRLETAPDPAAAADLVRRREGLAAAPGFDHPDWDAGIATAGLELAHGLPADSERVFVAPSALAAPVARGLAAGGRPIAVVGVDAVPGEVQRLERLRGAVLAGVRIDSDPAALAALAAALAPDAGSSPCALLSS